MKILKKILNRYFPIFPVAFILGGVFFSPSCANTTTPPSGGDKDTIPPVIVGINPLPGTTNVPVNTQIEIEFDEYITVKEPKGIFLSPPLSKNPRYRIRGKSLIVYFEEDLRDNTTYTLDFVSAIADNNEGNIFPGYSIVFSTGSTIDSMVVTGTVRDCNTLQPIKDATVLLYKDHSDSAAFKHRPNAAIRTDDWGYFAIRNIQDTLYKLYAIIDDAGNNIYDPDRDKIAFIDSLIRPVMVARDDLPELLKYDMEDTVKCMARKSEHELVVFREKPSKQLILNKMRTGDRTAYMTFMAPGAQIDSIWVRNIPSRRLIMQFNQERDSLELWINDQRKIPDTLHVFVDYLKTDTNEVLAPFTEHLRLVSEKKRSTSKSSRRDIKHEDTTCVIKMIAEDETIEQYGFRMEFDYPIINESFDEVRLISINPRQQESDMGFEVTRDSTNLRAYTIMPKDKLQKGYEYILKIPHRKFRNINGHYNDSTDVKVSLPDDDKLSLLSVQLKNVEHDYIIDLLNENRRKVLRSYHVNSDSTLDFPYLTKGKYTIRIIEDKNSNGLVDTGNVLAHQQPEKVKFYKMKNDSYVIELPEATELVQTIDVKELFEN